MFYEALLFASFAAADGLKTFEEKLAFQIQAVIMLDGFQKLKDVGHT